MTMQCNTLAFQTHRPKLSNALQLTSKAFAVQLYTVTLFLSSVHVYIVLTCWWLQRQEDKSYSNVLYI